VEYGISNKKLLLSDYFNLLLCSIFLLTIADVLFTHYGLRFGVITEANPLMAWLFTVNYPLAIALPVVLVSAACLVFYWARHRVAWLPAAVWALLAIKVGVTGMHGYWILKV